MVSQGARLPIALLIDTLDDEYQVAVVRGALSAARDIGVPVLCVAGGRVGDSMPDRAARNSAFELLGAESVSGVVAVTSVIGSAIGAKELGAWLGRFERMPLCCVGVRTEGHVTVEVDNSSGIRELVLHLVRQHARRRIAFIQGPSGSAEARARFGAYQAALAEAGLAFDPRLAVEGDFRKPSGAEAMRTLLQERNPTGGPIDGLVAANDYMALGAMQELARRHVEVPGAISVAGFDDVDSARFVRPALTTASQPTEELGRRGVLGVYELAQGRPFDSVSLLTKVVIRSSCGCPTQELGITVGVAAFATRSVEISFVQRRQTILAEMSRAGAGRLGAAGSGWETRLLDALIVELRGAGGSPFYRAFEHVLQKLERAPVAGLVLQDVLTALRRQSLPCVAGVASARDKLEDALHEARVLLGVRTEEAVERRAREQREIERTFESSIRAVLFSGSADLSRVAAERLPDFGIDACVVAAFTEPGDPTSPARVLCGFGSRAQISGSEALPVRHLPRHPVFDNAGRVQVALPLVAFGQALGVAIVSTSRVPDHELEEVREFLGTALDTLRRSNDTERPAPPA
jgi:DNA-binding LacI/PurR family transcriptional regulator